MRTAILQIDFIFYKHLLMCPNVPNVVNNTSFEPQPVTPWRY